MRYQLREYEDWDSIGHQLVDTLTDEVIASDGWVADCPEDATLTRGFAPLVYLINDLHDRWVKDCTTLHTAAMYGNPPGGWDDPARRNLFSQEVQDIEERLREATP